MSVDQSVEAIITALERQGPVRPEGKGWRAQCPSPDHEDRRPSFFLYPSGGGRCFSQCSRYWNAQALAELLGITVPVYTKGLSVAELADAKGIPVEFLERIGVSNGVAGSGQSRSPCVDITYTDERGEILAVRKRLSLEGNPRFLWRRGDRVTLYGLGYLAEVRKAGKVILVEGESDTWALWLNHFPAVGLPGSSTWREEYRYLLEGLELFIWHEPDEAGDKLLQIVSSDISDVRVIEPPAGVKDPSELYLLDPEHFKERMEALLIGSIRVSELRAEAFTSEARKALVTARPLLRDAELLSMLSKVFGEAGYAGDVRPALMAYVAVTSRLTESPLNLGYLSQSASGKNAAIDAALPFFPDESYYLVRASSPRALIYNEEQFAHRTVILTEADNLPEDGPAASAMRSLMSDHEMTYEVVEKGSDGAFAARRITKLGPTGLITTSVKPLGDQASTRMLSVTLSDSEDQTRRILHAQADRGNFALPPPDTERWVALQYWLEMAGERRVVIPFAHALADLVPARTVRVRRDFAQLLIVIKTVAMLYQLQRDRDPQGSIVATLEDYGNARWLLEDFFTATVTGGLTKPIRETVDTVGRLISEVGSPITQVELAAELKLAPSSVNYRVQRAIRGGWLVDKAQRRGAPSQLVLGDPLPDGSSLPEVDALLVRAGDPELNANSRTVGSEADGDGSEAIRTVTNTDSNPGAATRSHRDERFERFEPSEQESAHTRNHLELEGGDSLPWDDFLAEEDHVR